MQAFNSFLLTAALGTAAVYYLNQPYVPGPPCPEHTPEFLAGGD